MIIYSRSIYVDLLLFSAEKNPRISIFWFPYFRVLPVHRQIRSRSFFPHPLPQDQIDLDIKQFSAEEKTQKLVGSIGIGIASRFSLATMTSCSTGRISDLQHTSNISTDPTTREMFDETQCGPFCQHPTCWDSRRRLARGTPRVAPRDESQTPRIQPGEVHVCRAKGSHQSGNLGKNWTTFFSQGKRGFQPQSAKQNSNHRNKPWKAYVEKLSRPLQK